MSDGLKLGLAIISLDAEIKLMKSPPTHQIAGQSQYNLAQLIIKYHMFESRYRYKSYVGGWYVRIPTSDL